MTGLLINDIIVKGGKMYKRELDTTYYKWFEDQNNPNKINNIPIPAIDVHRREQKHKPKTDRKVTSQQEINIGDEIADKKDGIRSVILDIDDDILFVYTENGCVEEWDKNNIKQTGRKYNIQSILNSLQR